MKRQKVTITLPACKALQYLGREQGWWVGSAPEDLIVSSLLVRGLRDTVSMYALAVDQVGLIRQYARWLEKVAHEAIDNARTG